MRWEGNEQSDNVEDRRSEGGGGGGGGGFIGGRSIGIGTIAVALIAGWVFGINPLTVLSLLSGGGGPAQVQKAQAHYAQERAALAASATEKSAAMARPSANDGVMNVGYVLSR